MSKETKYLVGVLLKSGALAGYQKDFAKVLLDKPEYTISEAKSALDQFFKGKDVK